MFKEIKAYQHNILGLTDFITLRLCHDNNIFRTKNRVIYVLDRSYSMRDNDLNIIKKSILNLIKENNEEVYLIAFGGHKKYCNYNLDSNEIIEQDKKYTWQVNNDYEPDYTFHNFNNKSIQKIKKELEKIRPKGNTSFYVALNVLMETLELLGDNKQTDIVFITDGYDSSHIKKKELNKLVEDFNKSVSKTTNIHCVGISSSHDIVFLTDILSETYQYVKHEDLEHQLMNIKKIIRGKRIKIILEVGNEEIDINVNDITEKEIICSSVILQKIEENRRFVLHINHNEEKGTYIIELINVKESNILKLKEILTYYAYVYGKINNNENPLMSKENLNKIYKFIDNFDPQNSNNRDEKKLITKIYQKIKTMTDIIRKIENIDTLSNFETIVLMDTVYADVTLSYKIDKTQCDKISDRTTEIAEKYIEKSEELLKKYNNIVESVGPCVYTLSNSIELMEDGDCLCLTLKIDKDNNIEILKTGESKFMGLGACSFIEIIEEHKMVGDRFGKINCIFPLYLFKEHWKIAKHWMKPILSYIMTKKIDQYKKEYSYTFPFKILEKALEDYIKNNNSVNKLILEKILETCIQICHKEDKLLEIVKERLTNYVKSIENRGPKIIPDQKLFLVQVYSLMKANIISFENGDKLMKEFLVEEIFRKEQDTHELSPKDILEIVGEQKKDWVTKKKEILELADLEEIYSNNIVKKPKMINKISQLVSNKVEESKDRDPTKWEPQFNNSNKREFINTLIKGLSDRMKYEIKMLNHIFEMDMDLEKMGLNNILKKTVFVIRLLTGHRACKSFDQEESLKFIKEKFIDAVRKLRNKTVLGNVTFAEEDENFGQRLKLFILTEDITAAAGAVYGTYIGRNIRKFIFALLTFPCVKPIEKIKLLLDGQYQNVILYKDYDHQQDSRWEMGRQNCFKLWYKYRTTLTTIEWMQLYSKCLRNSQRILTEWNRHFKL